MTAQQAELLLESERGTVWIASDDSCAYVKGSEQPYWIPLPALTCECRGFEIRRHCFHVEAVKAKLRERHPCLLCDGYVLTRLEFEEGKGYVL